MLTPYIKLLYLDLVTWYATCLQHYTISLVMFKNIIQHQVVNRPSMMFILYDEYTHVRTHTQIYTCTCVRPRPLTHTYISKSIVNAFTALSFLCMWYISPYHISSLGNCASLMLQSKEERGSTSLIKICTT